ncbi:MAG: terpene cyclase/mutase family protein [Planctomycetes bacterium]|nr:terpene cyclase/mutase family protein [Planctomycetota bacterium]
MRVALAAALTLLGSLANAQDTPRATHPTGGLPKELDVDAARDGAARLLGFLVTSQNENGSWGNGVLDGPIELGYSIETYYAWNLAANALALMALMESEPTENHTQALRRGIEWFTSTRIAKRGSDWDSDYMWPALYGTVAMVRALDHEVAKDAKLRAAIERRGKEFVAQLVKNQSPLGGWAYYDNRPYTRRATWATSFCTAAVLPALQRAHEIDWPVDTAVVARAQRYVERCRLPNGAYEYDLRPIPRVGGGEEINHVKGSLGRIQVCQWALHELGSTTVGADDIREGLERFFEHHKFLDVARMRPIPHEAYYANAGYFYFFGHYYASKAIQRLPQDEREAWHRRLRPHVIKAIRANGSTSDFLASEYTIVAGTAFAAMTLLNGISATD